MQLVIRWIRNNIGSLLLAFLLSFAVWISAVVAADPNDERTLRSIDLELIGLPSDLVVVNDLPDQIRVTLNAPNSIWDRLLENPNLIRAWVDLSGLSPGEHTLEIKTQVDLEPVRFVDVDPGSVKIQVEPLVKRVLPVELVMQGELPVGYRRGDYVLNPTSIAATGPQTAVEKIAQARVDLNISGAVDTIDIVAPVELIDDTGASVSGVVNSPKEVSIYMPVSLLGRFKNVAVKAVTTGQVSNGYRLTNISVTPPNVTVFSEDPNLINDLPGFVESMPVNLDNLVDDAVVSVGLSLPEGITSVREPTVIVQVSVAAIESSLTINLPLEVIGLEPGLQAILSPENIDVILAGPLLVLERISKDNFLMVLDLTGLEEGVYQIVPAISLAPEEVKIQTTLPESVEVIIEVAPPSTGTPGSMPATATPMPSITGGPTPTGP